MPALASLKGLKVAVLVADQTHDEELNFPRYWLQWEGVKVVVAGLRREHISKWGRSIKADTTIDQLRPEDFDSVVIPGGFGPDYLRSDPNALSFVKKMMEEGKLVAAICHAPWVLVSAGLVRGRRLTCTPQITDDVINAGGKYEDSAVVVDGNLITSRYPPDLPPFTEAIIQALSKKVVTVATGGH